MPLPRQGPIAASIIPRVPHAISVTSRACGPGTAPSPSAAPSCAPFSSFSSFSFFLFFLVFLFPPAPGRPKTSAFAAVSATPIVVPSQATASSPQICDHGAVPGDNGEHNRRNTDSSGFSPSRRRTPVSPPDDGTRQPTAASFFPSPAVTCPITLPYGLSVNRHSPSTKYTPTRAGSDRSRISHASPSPTASSATSGGTTYLSTPSPASARTCPRADDQPHDVAR